MYLDCIGILSCPHVFYQNCRTANQKYVFHARSQHRIPGQTLAGSSVAPDATLYQSAATFTASLKLTEVLCAKASHRYVAENIRSNIPVRRPNRPSPVRKLRNYTIVDLYGTTPENFLISSNLYLLAMY